WRHDGYACPRPLLWRPHDVVRPTGPARPVRRYPQRRAYAVRRQGIQHHARSEHGLPGHAVPRWVVPPGGVRSPAPAPRRPGVLASSQIRNPERRLARRPEPGLRRVLPRVEARGRADFQVGRGPNSCVPDPGADAEPAAVRPQVWQARKDTLADVHEGVDVKWSEQTIARALAQQTFNRKYLVVVPNCNWTGYEADILAVTENLRLID